MKKILVVLSIIIAIFISYLPIIDASGTGVVIYVFTKDGEEISKNALDYLNSLKEDSEIANFFSVAEVQIWNKNWREDSYNKKLADRVAEHFNETIEGAPYIVIGNNYSASEFSEEKKTEIYNAIINAFSDENYEDVVAKYKNAIEEENKNNGLITVGIILLVAGSLSIIILLARKGERKE